MRLYELIALMGVIAGWAATHLLSEARERRKEIRGQIDKIVERLQTLEDNSRAFHMGPSWEAPTHSSLIAEIDRVERVVDRVTAFKVDSLVPSLIRLRRAVTLRNFDHSNFKQQDLGSEILHYIASAVYDMEDEMEIQYRLRYPSRFPYFLWPWQQ